MIKNKKITEDKIFKFENVHKLCQYLYDNGLHFPKSQKTLFVAALLLTLKIKPDFIKSLNPKDKGFIIAHEILKILTAYYNDNKFTNSFGFIENSFNNEHLINILKFLDYDFKDYNSDILNQFYNEFMIYDKNNEGQLGIVLTPPDIVDIMVDSLNIQPNESIADFATGTGSFLMKASTFTNNLIGCELNEERYALAKCNFILNDLPYNNLYFNNCFNQKFSTYDHIIMNPPFSCTSSDNGENNDFYGFRNFKNEQRFCLYQLQYLKDGGTGCWIIPRSNFNNTVKKTNQFKQILLNNLRILKIINCNSKVFMPAASVECTIIIFKKQKVKEEYKTEIINYADDGYEIKKKQRIKTHEPKSESYNIILKAEDDWNYTNREIKRFTVPEINIYYKICNLKSLRNELNKQIEYLNQRLKYITDTTDYKFYFLEELLEPIKITNHKYNLSESGKYPVFGCAKSIEPIGYTDTFDIDCETLGIEKALTISKLGGYCYLRYGRFNAYNCNVYRLKKDLSEEDVEMLTDQLHQQFNTYSIRFNNSYLKTINVYLPVKEDYNKEDSKTIKIEENIKDTIKEYKQIKISDYFDIIKPKKIFKISETQKGDIPLISSTSENNGITKYIDDFSYDCNNDYLTVSRNGSVGFCFVQTGKIGITTDIIILKPKREIDLKILSIILTDKLTKIFNYSYKITNNKLLSIIVEYPIFN